MTEISFILETSTSHLLDDKPLEHLYQIDEYLIKKPRKIDICQAVTNFLIKFMGLQSILTTEQLSYYAFFKWCKNIPEVNSTSYFHNHDHSFAYLDRLCYKKNCALKTFGSIRVKKKMNRKRKRVTSSEESKNVKPKAEEELFDIEEVTHKWVCPEPGCYDPHSDFHWHCPCGNIVENRASQYCSRACIGL